MECTLAGETEVLGENLPQRHFCPSQNPTWSDSGLIPGRHGGKPATNRLNYGAANVGLYFKDKFICGTFQKILFKVGWLLFQTGTKYLFFPLRPDHLWYSLSFLFYDYSSPISRGDGWKREGEKSKASNAEIKNFQRLISTALWRHSNASG
jgi:hypothetical protein